MRSRAMHWKAEHLREKRARGGLAGVDSEEKNPLRGLFDHEGAKGARLRSFLETGPQGERDVEPLLDRLAAERAPLERWLRGVLDACDD